jgi:hypothetical protein
MCWFAGIPVPNPMSLPREPRAAIHNGRMQYEKIKSKPLNVSKSVESDVADYLPNGLELFYAIKYLAKQPINRSKKDIKDN